MARVLPGSPTDCIFLSNLVGWNILDLCGNLLGWLACSGPLAKARVSKRVGRSAQERPVRLPVSLAEFVDTSGGWKDAKSLPVPTA
jgi:hypothetical protein